MHIYPNIIYNIIDKTQILQSINLRFKSNRGRLRLRWETDMVVKMIENLPFSPSQYASVGDSHENSYCYP